MSQRNAGGGHNGNRSRELQSDGSQSGNQHKRPRSPGSDFNDVSRERSARIREEFNERDPDELIRQGAQLRANLTTGAGLPLGKPVPAMVSSPSKAMEILSQAPSDSVWILARAPTGIFGQPPVPTSMPGQSPAPASILAPSPVPTSVIEQGPLPTNPFEVRPLPASGLGLPPSRHLKRLTMAEGYAAATRRHPTSIASRQSVPGDGSNRSQTMPRVEGLHCKICNSETHEAEHCCQIVDDNKLTDRQQGFKRWCPRHQTASHTMDQCKQKWDWLRNEKDVQKRLALGCGAGPAFATNLIDWRCMVEDNWSVPLPWTPEFARTKKKEDPEFHERLARDSDPETSSASKRRNLPWQTENGLPPQFSSFDKLRQYAEQEYQGHRG
ncbi:hypothetical protein F5Y09DRAFT_350179 [Xylaria sp. FL1042]|nr:hypothetical protein F5Y09DRAFT_350179 [Xylaria sp. FL1042]